MSVWGVSFACALQACVCRMCEHFCVSCFPLSASQCWCATAVCRCPRPTRKGLEFRVEENSSSETGAECLTGVSQSFRGRLRTTTERGCASCRGLGQGSLQAWRGLQRMTSGMELGAARGPERHSIHFPGTRQRCWPAMSHGGLRTRSASHPDPSRACRGPVCLGPQSWACHCRRHLPLAGARGWEE